MNNRAFFDFDAASATETTTAGVVAIGVMFFNRIKKRVLVAVLELDLIVEVDGKHEER